MELKLNYQRAVVILGIGTDQILLTLDKKIHKTPYPGLDYSTIVEIETQHGYGVEYCKQLGISEFEIIKV